MSVAAVPTPPNAETAFLNVEESLDRLMQYVESRDYCGYDPCDALNSPILRTIGRLGKYPRIAVIQFMKRFPINTRSLFLVAKGHNPKGLGLFIGGYAKLHRAGYQSQDFGARIERLLELLRNCRSPGCSGNAWGYNFDWQSRAFYVPKNTPTIVNSSFIGHALLELFEATGDQRALDLALPIRDFILKDLPRIQCGDAFCFSYTPLKDTPVHNANLLGASLLIRLNRYVDDSEVRQAALSSLKYTMDHQHEDGSWWYAEPEYQNWVDSFHTGFNLQAIDYFLREGEANEYVDAFYRGVQFYREHFFLNDGTAKYFHDRLGPIDIHSYAQAIVFFSRLGGDHLDLVNRLVKKLLGDFQGPDGYFYFQKTQRFTNRIPYMRWAQSWAFHALTEYVNTSAQEQKDLQLC